MPRARAKTGFTREIEARVSLSLAESRWKSLRPIAHKWVTEMNHGDAVLVWRCSGPGRTRIGDGGLLRVSLATVDDWIRC